MKIYHTSPSRIEKIKDNGLFGECLFFSNEIYQMGAGEVVVYSLDVEKIIVASNLDDNSVIQDIANYFEIDEDEAEKVLTGRTSVFNIGGDGEDDWWVQGKQGEAAKNMGYEAVKSEDEQGAVYIVPMLGRENDLIEVK